MGRAFYGTSPNLNYAVNRLNDRNSLLEKLLEALGGIVGGIENGSGVQASNAKVEEAVKWAIDKADKHFITYSKDNRNLKKPEATSFDCSSFIITAFYAVGVDIEATYTGDMRSGFVKAGWKWIPGSYWAAKDLRRGDIMLNEALHTQMYIGNNEDVNCGSTPARTCTHSPDYYGTGWDGILRYE